jgi:hypothetical protein
MGPHGLLQKYLYLYLTDIMNSSPLANEKKKKEPQIMKAVSVVLTGIK